MQILALLRTLSTATPSRLAPLVKPEAAEIWALHLNGTLRAAHFLQAPDTPFPSGVVLMLETDTTATAEALIAALPMVAEGLITAEILPLAPFTSYAALFANTPSGSEPPKETSMAKFLIRHDAVPADLAMIAAVRTQSAPSRE